MAHPTLEDARQLSDWKPPLGVISVFLGFDPADRGGAWRTELRNGLDCVLEAAKEAEHERRVALRATAKRLTERFEDGDLRPPPRGEAGFVEVAEKGGAEHWWGTGARARRTGLRRARRGAGAGAAGRPRLPRRRPAASRSSRPSACACWASPKGRWRSSRTGS